MIDPDIRAMAGTADDPSTVGAGVRAPNPITQWHRGFALLAVVSLFIGTADLWQDAVPRAPAVALVISACYAAMMGAAVLVTTVSSRRLMTVVEAGILGVAVVLACCLFLLHHGATDEGVLAVRAADAIRHGTPAYGVHWPDIRSLDVGFTKTMDGGIIDTYPYPPLMAILTAAVGIVVQGYVAAGVVTMASLIAGAVLQWRLMPPLWGSPATALVLGFGLLPAYAHRGYPAVIACVLLIPVAIAWTSTGVAGRLDRRAVVRAICLGAACATQQLAWFLVPFLLVGIWSVRRGELPVPQAARVVGLFTAIAGATFLLINLPFIAADPRAWLEGISTPLTSHAVPYGQGLVGISYHLLEGSGALTFYNYAALSVAIGLLVATVLFMRRLGPALFVLPWIIFLFSVRSQDIYYAMMTPLWLASLATVASGAFASAWQPRGGLLGRRRVRWALLVVLSAPALACLGVAIATPAPLQMRVLAVIPVEGKSDVAEIHVRVANTGSSVLRPHFAVSNNYSMGPYFLKLAGPDALSPGQTGDYRLKAPRAGIVPGPRGFFRLRALTDDPVTLNSTTVPAASSSAPIEPSTSAPP
ncbi:MAG: hypothetical protein ABWY52_00460 [Candidatus Limnocylindrales bacterium]